MFDSITKLFKSKEFYLQLDEAEAGKVESQAPAKKPEPAEQPEPAKAATATPEPAKEPESVQATATAKPAKAKAKKSAKQPEPVKATAASTNGKVEPQPGLTFAPNYLLPLPTSRRRPGPSMNKFREMARGVKTPK